MNTYAVELTYHSGSERTEYADQQSAREACEQAFWLVPKPTRVTLLVRDAGQFKAVWSLAA